jgi:hypothetical protein
VLDAHHGAHGEGDRPGGGGRGWGWVGGGHAVAMGEECHGFRFLLSLESHGM